MKCFVDFYLLLETDICYIIKTSVKSSSQPCGECRGWRCGGMNLTVKFKQTNKKSNMVEKFHLFSMKILKAVGSVVFVTHIETSPHKLYIIKGKKMKEKTKKV